jgi:hypothetical protein
LGTYVSPLQSAEGPKDVNKVMARFVSGPLGVIGQFLAVAIPFGRVKRRARVFVSFTHRPHLLHAGSFL